jgi:hypothetical protein
MGQLLNRPSSGGVAGKSPIGASVSLSNVLQSIANGAVQAVSFDTKNFDTSGFVVGALPALFFTAPFAGLYTLFGGAQWLPNATGVRNIGFVVNNNGAFIGSQVFTNAPATIGQTTSALVNLNAGDVVNLSVVQSSGAALQIAGSNVNLQTYFQILGAH